MKEKSDSGGVDKFGNAPTIRAGKGRLPLLGLAFSILSSITLVVIPYISVPFALIGIALSLAHRRDPGAAKGVVRAALIIGTLTLVVAVVLALFLIPVSESNSAA